MKKILYAKPSITQLEIDYVSDAVTHGWGEQCYDYLIRFKTLIRQHLGVAHAFPTSSCTGALHMGMAALGVGPGDEVIVPDATWIASVAPVTYLGAKPVFVDVDAKTWCIDSEKIAAAITPNTKAVIIVHLYGASVDMDAVRAVTEAHQIPIIEDAAEGIGTLYKGVRAGALGTLGVFSFHGTKTLTTGEGGVLVTNDDSLAEQLVILDNHGRDPKVPRMFWCEQVGFKYRMSNLQAALGCAQIERIDELIQSKREIFHLYQIHSKDVPDIRWNFEAAETVNGYWMPTLILGESHPISRDSLLQALNEKGVSARPFFYPVSSFPTFETCSANTVSFRLGERGLNLPSYFDMTEDDVRYACDVLRESLQP